MTDSNAQQPNVDASNNVRADTSRVLEELSRSNSAKVRPRRNGLRRFLILMVLLLPVIVVISFLLYEQSRTDAILAELQSRDIALEQALAQVPTLIPEPMAPLELSLPDNLADTRMLDELSASLDSRINALARNAANMQERIGALPQARSSDELMWAEAEYLLRLANQKLQLEGDGDSAS